MMVNEYGMVSTHILNVFEAESALTEEKRNTRFEVIGLHVERQAKVGTSDDQTASRLDEFPVELRNPLVYLRERVI
jgi:hypothetical protein